ncbi:hypothetical protein TNCV_4409071 [Trichonephila clavipes]|nr:hypothetical protein TNCV_4409071 [Trichonephila clavipes]
MYNAFPANMFSRSFPSSFLLKSVMFKKRPLGGLPMLRSDGKKFLMMSYVLINQLAEQDVQCFPSKHLPWLLPIQQNCGVNRLLLDAICQRHVQNENCSSTCYPFSY